jgi:hypothetical protein
MVSLCVDINTLHAAMQQHLVDAGVGAGGAKAAYS